MGSAFPRTLDKHTPCRRNAAPGKWHPRCVSRAECQRRRWILRCCSVGRRDRQWATGLQARLRSWLLRGLRTRPRSKQARSHVVRSPENQRSLATCIAPVATPKERSPANGASAAPAGVRLTCGVADGGREKTEDPDGGRNAANIRTFAAAIDSSLILSCVGAFRFRAGSGSSAMDSKRFSSDSGYVRERETGDGHG